MSTLSTSLGTLFNTLTSSGVAEATAQAIVKGVAGNSALKSTLSGLIQQAVIDQNNPAALSKLATDISTTPGCPLLIANAAPGLVSAAQNPAQFMSLVGSIESQINQL